MKTTGVDQAKKNPLGSWSSLWAISLCLLLVLPLFLLATEAEAAKIIFEPNTLSTTVAPGDVVKVPVAVSLVDTITTSPHASFILSNVDGNQDSSCMDSQVYVILNSYSKTTQALVPVGVPADVKNGKYPCVFKMLWLNSNEQVTPADLLINVEVSEPFACNKVPSFSDISSAEETINVRNHKEVAIDLSGAVSVPEGCDILNAWYQLIDEYGELDQEEVPLEINDDGTFSVAVPMIASRKGQDKDGRLYTVKFIAENEAGVGESSETTVVVLHDNLKEESHDIKRRDHESKRRDHTVKR